MQNLRCSQISHSEQLGRRSYPPQKNTKDVFFRDSKIAFLGWRVPGTTYKFWILRLYPTPALFPATRNIRMLAVRASPSRQELGRIFSREYDQPESRPKDFDAGIPDLITQMVLLLRSL